MTQKISGKIVGYDVVKKDVAQATTDAPVPTLVAGTGSADVIRMHEALERPQKLVGSTYKLKTPEHVSAHAMYITINDIVLNEGTEHEHRRPFEVFINSKNLEHYQWIVALTLIMSAVFRKGGDITFLVDELRSVFDPRGGYWNKGKYVPSIIAEIGEVIEGHLVSIGMIAPSGPDEATQQMLEAKRAELKKEFVPADEATGTVASADEAWMANATHCAKCQQKSVVLRDGCQTCMNCGDSKCG